MPKAVTNSDEVTFLLRDLEPVVLAASLELLPVRADNKRFTPKQR